jgi:hypothetical protein
MRRFGRSAIMACGLAALSLATAAAAPAVPGWVAYSNGTVMGEGEPGLCVVDAVMIDPGGEDTIDFQFVGSADRFGFKLGAGTFDPATRTFQPRRIADADFAGVRFDYRQAFGRRVLSGGQLVAMLGRSMLNQDFYQAFFLGHFVVLVQRADVGETTAWFVEQAPSEPVRRTFLDCLKGLSSPG